MTSMQRAVAIVRSYSTRRKSELMSAPSEIPFQPKVANCVNLVGQVGLPVQFQTAPNGTTWAATVITRQHLWIPVLFEGDLAHTAASHLKQNDFIHIVGQLTADPQFARLQNQPQTSVQVMAQSLNFVQGYPQHENVSTSSVSQKNDINQSREDIHSKESEEDDIDKSWKGRLSNPIEWWDVRLTKENPKGAAFERKMNGELLFINSSTPRWLQEKQESMTFDLKPDMKSPLCGAKNDPDSSISSWRDLLDNPKQWCDFRDSKISGLVNPRHPDFKRKDGSVALWLNQAPKWVLSNLTGLKFDVLVVKSKQAEDSKGDNSWSDLLRNPDKWWDNRSNKKNERYPDFKHKETGEGLWLNHVPAWVLSKLPPLKPKQSVEIGSK